MQEALNHAKLAMLFRKEFELCNVRKGETIVLLSDLGARRDYVSAAFAAAEDFGADAYEMCVNAMPSWTKVGVETVGRCKGTLDAIKAADMLVCLHIPLFTRWLKEARDAGTRVLMIIDGPDELEDIDGAARPQGGRDLRRPAPRTRQDHAHHAPGRHRPHRQARRISDHDPVRLFRERKGRFDHWGAGHVHTFPNEGTANGTVVFAPGDIVVLPYCRYVQDEVRLDIRDGFIRKIEGGLDAKLMSDWLDGNKANADDMDGHAISHLGWGLNPQGRWDALALNGADPVRHHAGARCFAGNFLFSTGPNSQGGGKRTTKGHYDVPMRDCTVALDNDVIIERGKFADDKMRVAFVPR